LAGKIAPIDIKEEAKSSYNIVPVIDERSRPGFFFFFITLTPRVE